MGTGPKKALMGTGVSVPAGFQPFEKPAVVNLYIVYSRFVNRATFQLIDEEDERLKNMVELGISIGTRPRASQWGFKLPNMGLSYVAGDHLKGVKLNFGFPF